MGRHFPRYFPLPRSARPTGTRSSRRRSPTAPTPPRRRSPTAPPTRAPRPTRPSRSTRSRLRRPSPSPPRRRRTRRRRRKRTDSAVQKPRAWPHRCGQAPFAFRPWRLSYPAWIRTRTKRTKISCATVTPPGTGAAGAALDRILATPPPPSKFAPPPAAGIAGHVRTLDELLVNAGVP